MASRCADIICYPGQPAPSIGMPRHMIVCAAIRDASGQVVCGVRHFDSVMHGQIARMASYVKPWEQGFMDNRGQFLTREQAWTVADAAGQIIRRVGGDNLLRLFSENLY